MGAGDFYPLVGDLMKDAFVLECVCLGSEVRRLNTRTGPCASNGSE